jgi:hypothetical protein
MWKGMERNGPREVFLVCDSGNVDNLWSTRRIFGAVSLTRQHGVHVNVSSDVAKIQHKAIVHKIHAEPDDIEHQGILPHVWSAKQIHDACLGLVS